MNIAPWTKNTQNIESAVGGSKPNTKNSFIRKAEDMLDTYAKNYHKLHRCLIFSCVEIIDHRDRTRASNLCCFCLFFPHLNM